MRFVQDIPHPHFRIGLYAWNGKQLIKIDAGPYEQTYKISDTDLASPEDVLSMLDESFLSRVADRFQQMDTDWRAAGDRHDVFL